MATRFPLRVALYKVVSRIIESAGCVKAFNFLKTAFELKKTKFKLFKTALLENVFYFNHTSRTVKDKLHVQFKELQWIRIPRYVQECKNVF